MAFPPEKIEIGEHKNCIEISVFPRFKFFCMLINYDHYSHLCKTVELSSFDIGICGML